MHGSLLAGSLTDFYEAGPRHRLLSDQTLKLWCGPQTQGWMSPALLEVIVRDGGRLSITDLYGLGVLQRADDKPVANGVRCAYVYGKYKKENCYSGQCQSQSFGRVFCRLHDHLDDVHERALFVMCCLWFSPIRLVLKRERQVVTQFMADCLFGSEVTGSEVIESESSGSIESESDDDPDYDPSICV